jgi:hypothetical protein
MKYKLNKYRFPTVAVAFELHIWSFHVLCTFLPEDFCYILDGIEAEKQEWRLDVILFLEHAEEPIGMRHYIHTAQIKLFNCFATFISYLQSLCVFQSLLFALRI